MVISEGHSLTGVNVVPKLSAAAIKIRIEKLQKQLRAAEATKAPAVNKVRVLMKKLGVTVGDLTGARSLGLPGRPPKSSVSSIATGTGSKAKRPRRKVAVKFRDDKGNTWTGRGKLPRWLSEAEKNGRGRDSYRVNS
ncbi:MAG: H-NS histone family protein [Gammaproteobacteria bacterium]|nr:H-NS histone family protein [Gammaproteobacteria bacterium]